MVDSWPPQAAVTLTKVSSRWVKQDLGSSWFASELVRE